MNIIRKIIAPTKQCHEDYLTIWVADLEKGSEIYLQTSKETEKPEWQRLGNLFEEMILEQEFQDNNFLLNLYLPKRIKILS